MGYRPQHRKKTCKGTIAAFAVVTAAGFSAALALPAGAVVPTVPKVSNTAIGEAGYFVNDNGQTRIRDVQATTVITPQMENLNGTGPGTDVVSPAQPGGVGVELCNDNTGYAAQLGLEWDASASRFIAEYGWSSDGAKGDPLLAVTSGSDPDPCTEGGLLDGGSGEVFANFLNAAPDTAAGAIHVGDTIHFEIYYNPRGRFFHTLKFLVRDVTQDVTRVQTVNIRAQNFYEAGIGIVTQANSLTGGAVNLISTFSGAFFNWYGNRGAPPAGIDSTHWDLQMADFVNGSNQVTLTPGGLTTGNTSFPMLEGSTSA